MTRLEISSDLLARIRAHAASDPDNEICGLLLGEAQMVTAVVPVKNVSPDPARHFEIDAAALFGAIRRGRAGGPQLLGYYHSHPDGRAEPSATDRACAAPDGKAWLIVAGDAVTGWRAGPGGFERLQMG